MEIDRELLLRYMTSTNLLESQAIDIIESFKFEDYEDFSDMKKDIDSLKRRVDNAKKFQKEIHDLYFR